MEYSVYDLIRILIKKWYVILLCMCIIGGMAFVTARTSYKQAVKQYEEQTTQIVDTCVNIGTLTASYKYDYCLTDFSKYIAEAIRKVEFFEQFSEEFTGESTYTGINVAVLAEQAYEKVSQDASKLLTDSRMMRDTQTAIDAFRYLEPPTISKEGTIVLPTEALSVTNHFAMEILDGNTIRITIFGLEESVGREILKAYLESMKAVSLSDYAMELTLSEQSAVFTPDPVRLTDSAALAQMVMKKPEQVPVMMKTIGTAVMYAFALGCFLVMVATFVKESRKFSATSSTDTD